MWRFQQAYIRPRRGAVLVLVGFLLMIVLIMAAFAVDVAYMQLTRTELRTATDAAARAGSEALSRLQSEPLALQAAQAAAQRNLVAGVPMQLADSDVVFGNVTISGDTANFTSGAPIHNKFRAVRILSRRTGGSSTGSVSLLLGHLLGIHQFEPQMPATSISLDRDICLVVDRSGSMNLATDGSYIPSGADPCIKPHPTLSRWAGLRVAYDALIQELEDTRPQEKLGLVSYSSAGEFCGIPFTEADIEHELSSSYTVITNRMNELTNGPIQGWTNITAGVARGIEVLTNPATNRPFAKRTMILMTDGLHNQGPPPITLAAQAVSEGIVIHTITYSSDADQAGMQALAAAAHGNHWHAPDGPALTQALREVARSLPVVLVE